MSVADLSTLSLPPEGEITLCEVDGKVHSMQYEFANISTFTTCVSNYPKIHLNRDALHRICSGEEGRALFLPVHESFLKQLVQIYYEHGLLEVLKTTAEHRENPLLAGPSSLILKVIDSIRNIRSSLNPYAKESGPKLISLLSQTRNWHSSPVRCIAWHELSNKIAVASLDDSVRIYCEDSTLVPILKSRLQKNITCIAWRPLSGSELAVGCQSGVFVWNVDPCSSVARPSINHATILKRLDHCPIIALAWSPLGDVLATGAALDGTIHVWNVEMNQSSALKKPGSSGTTILKWSRDGSKMFSASTGLVFRVWNCNQWTAERWNVLTGRVSAACWSPDSSILLFTTTEELALYCLPFVNYGEVFANPAPTPEVATPVLDFTKMEIDGVTVGGAVQAMDWDSNGTHLAVLFKDSDTVAVFVTSLKPAFQITPGFLVRGLPDEFPASMEFQKSFKHGALLTVAWSSGRVQYFPIIYSTKNFDSRSPDVSIGNNASALYKTFGSPSARNNSYYVVA